jgi:hypothetical protein
MKKLNLVGKRFGKLLVIKYIETNNDGKSIWSCLCDCGNIKNIVGTSLTRRIGTKSCGCLYYGYNNSNFEHGYSSTKIYRTWNDMIQRCNNINNKDYMDYGGRGIIVCRRWLKFENFLKDVGDPPKGLSLDRINNNKGYNPNNWRWTTHKINSRNRRDNHLISYKNSTRCISEWADITGISPDRILGRIKSGWSIKRTLTTPTKKRKK